MKLIFLILIIASIDLYAQREAENWLFGSNAGLNFSEGKAKSINGSLISLEGCASISDVNGKLLFYTDGKRIYNRNNQVMPNGDSIHGHTSATQTGIIIPMPYEPNKLYLFTVDAFEIGAITLSYSIIDMRLDDGNGDVVAGSKNIRLFSNVTEKITALRHSNGIDYWVITHNWDNDEFLAFLVNRNGIEAKPVISKVGTIHTLPPLNKQAALKASPDGKNLALGIYDDGIVELFKFNGSNGTVSNSITLSSVDYKSVYGIEFSPDANRLYISTLEIPSKIYQFDLADWDQSLIKASEKIITQTSKYFFGSLQIAPDGKIYIACKLMNYVAAINKPDSLGLNCEFIEKSVMLENSTCRLGLPAFCQSFFQGIRINSNSPICIGDTIKLNATDIPGGVYIWQGPNGFTSNLANPIIANADKSNSGIYTVLITDVGGRNFSASVEVSVVEIDIDVHDAYSLNIPDACLGKSSGQNLRFNNQSGCDIIIESIRLINDEQFKINTSNSLPIYVSKDSAYRFPITFTPNLATTFFDTLIIRVNQPCFAEFYFPINSSGKPTNTVFSIGDTIAPIGMQALCIPVRAVLNCSEYERFDLSLIATVSTNPSVFLITDVKNATLLDSYFSNGTQFTTFQDIIPDLGTEAQIISEICGMTLLGDSKTTPVSFVDLTLSDKLVNTETVAGSVSLMPICADDITRLKSFSIPEFSISQSGNELKISTLGTVHDNCYATAYSITGEQLFKINLGQNVNIISLENINSQMIFLQIRYNGDILSKCLWLNVK